MIGKNDALLAGVAVIGVIGLLSYAAGHAGELAAKVPAIVADAAVGVVVGTGDVLGIPRTNLTECELAIAEGRTWDSSFSCSLGRFVRGVYE